MNLKLNKHLQHVFEIFKRTCFCLAAIIVSKMVVGLFPFFEKLNPLTNKIEDFELSDLCFAHGHSQVPPDTNIIIVNCFKDDKASIARKISKIEKCRPAAIGMDLVFHHYDPKDTSLIDTINKYKGNIVMAHLTDDESFLNNEFYKVLQMRNNGNGSYAWGYLKAEELNKTKRYFEPTIKFYDKAVDVFSIRLLKTAYDSKFTEELYGRNKEKELINYRKSYLGVPRYKSYDGVFDPRLFANKIVLLGTLDTSSLYDLHYTPLNQYMGRSLPDMHGVEYHAQIMSMVINKDYINELNAYVEYIAIGLVCFGFMFLYEWLIKYHGVYHFVLDIFFITISVPLSIGICTWLLNAHSIKIEPTHFLIPVFLCSLFLHLYDPFVSSIKRIKVFKKVHHEKAP